MATFVCCEANSSVSVWRTASICISVRYGINISVWCRLIKNEPIQKEENICGDYTTKIKIAARLQQLPLCPQLMQKAVKF